MTEQEISLTIEGESMTRDSLIACIARPYTIVTDTGKKVKIEGERYVGFWLTDGEKITDDTPYFSGVVFTKTKTGWQGGDTLKLTFREFKDQVKTFQEVF